MADRRKDLALSESEEETEDEGSEEALQVGPMLNEIAEGSPTNGEHVIGTGIHVIAGPSKFKSSQCLNST